MKMSVKEFRSQWGKKLNILNYIIKSSVKNGGFFYEFSLKAKNHEKAQLDIHAYKSFFLLE